MPCDTTGKRMELGMGMVRRCEDVAMEPPGRDYFDVVQPGGVGYEDFLVLEEDGIGHQEYAVLEP